MTPFVLVGALPTFSSSDCDMLDLTLTALEAKGRYPCARPTNGLPGHFHAGNMARLYLEPHDDGWVANIEFRDVPPGQPNTVGTPDAFPLACERTAFLCGAALVCEIVTGSRELPFFVAGDRLICAAYR